MLNNFYQYGNVIFMCVVDMDSTQVSGAREEAREWTSDEQEIATLVEAFISQDLVPAEVEQSVERLQEAGDSHKALKDILDALD